MSYLTNEQMQDGQQSNTLDAGTEARVVLTGYEPFQSKKGNTIPKHLGFDNVTGARYEFVGFKFHEAVKELNDSIVPNVTVLDVQCLDNGTQYPDYEVNVTSDKANAEYAAATPKAAGGEEEITADSVPF